MSARPFRQHVARGLAQLGGGPSGPTPGPASCPSPKWAATVALWCAVAVSALTGCGQAAQQAVVKIYCNVPSNAMVLMAQAVPTASQLPCISEFPAGWSFDSIEVRTGLARFWLDSDRAGTKALEVSLSAGCTTRGTESPSDDPAAALWVLVQSTSPQVTGVRYYVFRGGCVTYHFSFPATPTTVRVADDVSLMVGLVSRERVAKWVSDEGETLYPPTSR